MCFLSSAGTVGDSLSSSQHPDVFVSTDGGYNWRGTLRGPHHYSILDSGGLVVAVEAHHEGQVKTIKYCTDMFAGIISQLILGDPVVILWLMSPLPGFPQMKASVGNPTTSLNSRSSLQAWRLSLAPRP